MNSLKQVSYPEWVKLGNAIVRRDALSFNHPEHPYNYIKRIFNVNPEIYGVFHPLFEKYRNSSKEELLNTVIELEKQILEYKSIIENTEL